MCTFGGRCHLEVNTTSLLISPFLGCALTEDVAPAYRVPRAPGTQGIQKVHRYEHKCQEMGEILFRQVPERNGYHVGLVRLPATHGNQTMYYYCMSTAGADQWI